MTDSLDKQIFSIGPILARINNLYKEWNFLKNIPFSTAQVFLILHYEGEVTQKHICEIDGYPKQTLNNVIRQLRNLGYVTLVTNENDKREKIIRLTESGKVYSKVLLDPLLEFNKKVIGRLGEETIQQMTKSLDDYANSIELEMELEKVNQKWSTKGMNP